ncbi:uroporphyrinogen-III C-methyltransferase [Chlorobium ferrooxidans]|uniref:uroporphyrinogen-III C-methyltransferase n=1 Tax=Chlorobium ferrooxidans DSM 13031 TaxID=377431 RepID=Q0YP66_9CHLB|nr:uroporphyrinogen-III C-methyltransferase [Chlorobium ferrooxidans]EAT58089.1 uroporphyrin-III C-methyltransferase [Chlorobium ferrooxidans DSM 13031]
MTPYPETLRLIAEHLDHSPAEPACFALDPFRLLEVTDDPLQALLDGRSEAALFPASALPEPLPDEFAVAALLSFRTVPDREDAHPLKDMNVIVVRHERADLKVLFAPLDIRRGYGKVYLTGAGAGSRDYLTLKADTLMQRAGVIFYDDLIDTGLLDAYRAEKVYVGKRKGLHHADQDAINRQLFAAALTKQIVVRLKGGDPLVFGRGGEELAWLSDRQIDVEVVPGVSSMMSAAASAGIPLTQRGVSGGVTLQSAHNVLAGDTPRTLVYFMCASRLKELQSTLLHEGIDGKTPVALIRKAGFFDEAMIMTTVEIMHTVELASPLLAIIGRTAALCRKRSKILHTGDDPYRCLLPGKIVPISDITAGGNPLGVVDLSLFSGIVFTGREQIDTLLAAFGTFPPHLVLYAEGRKTAELLRSRGYGRTVMEI